MGWEHPVAAVFWLSFEPDSNFSPRFEMGQETGVQEKLQIIRDRNELTFSAVVLEKLAAWVRGKE